MPSQPTTPLRLVRLTLVGSALLAVGFMFELIPGSPTGFYHLLVWGACALLLLGSAFTLSMVNQRRLRKGVKSGIWTEDQLLEARNFVEKRWMTALQMISLFAALAFAFIRILFHWHGASEFLLLMLAGNNVTMLKSILRRPSVATSVPCIDWSNANPIHSDQWGKQATPS